MPGTNEDEALDARRVHRRHDLLGPDARVPAVFGESLHDAHTAFSADDEVLVLALENAVG